MFRLINTPFQLRDAFRYTIFIAGLSVIIIYLTLPFALFAQPSAGHELEQAEQMFDAGLHENAEAAAQTLLTRDDLSATDRIAGLQIRALSLFALKKKRHARRVFAEICRLDPGHQLQSESKIAQREFKRSCRKNRRGVEITIHQEAHDHSHLHLAFRGALGAAEHLRFRFRYPPNIDFSEKRQLFPKTPTLSISLENPPNVDEMEYYVQLLAPSGFVLADLGTKELPLITEVRKQSASNPVDEEGISAWWWITPLLVGLAVGAGIGVYYLSQENSTPPSGTLGTVDLM